MDKYVYSKGQQFEKMALKLLLKHQHKLIIQNYQSRYGEIDLITQEKTQNKQGCLIFTEVRYRKSQTFGGALSSIDARKQNKIILTAQHFLQTHPKWQDFACRFDVIAFEGDQPIWIKSAFEC